MVIAIPCHNMKLCLFSRGAKKARAGELGYVDGDDEDDVKVRWEELFRNVVVDLLTSQ